MVRKITTFVVMVAMMNFCTVFAFASAPAEKEARQMAKIKTAIQKLGTGEKARVKLELKDKTKLEGYVSAAGDDSFAVTNPETGVTANVAYPQVSKVKGHNLSTGAKIAIGAGIVIAIAIAVLFATNEDEIEFPQ
jgi:hypothetical protein